jgi:group I intron endonuclease
MTKFGSVYKITNTKNGKAYIGITTKSIVVRFREHSEPKKKKSALHSAIKKYGKQNFTVEEIFVAFCEASLADAEKQLVVSFRTLYPTGYNLKDGGFFPKFTQEVKTKISKSKQGVPNFKTRGRQVTQEARIKISRNLGGTNIKATNLVTGEQKIYETAQSTRKDGFNPSNVVQICKGNNRSQTKGWFFEYYYANQSGSLENKNFKHAQRLGDEPVQTEYNSPTSPQQPSGLKR